MTLHKSNESDSTIVFRPAVFKIGLIISNFSFG